MLNKFQTKHINSWYLVSNHIIESEHKFNIPRKRKIKGENLSHHLVINETRDLKINICFKALDKQLIMRDRRMMSTSPHPFE